MKFAGAQFGSPDASHAYVARFDMTMYTRLLGFLGLTATSGSPQRCEPSFVTFTSVGRNPGGKPAGGTASPDGAVTARSGTATATVASQANRRTNRLPQVMLEPPPRPVELRLSR
jgi:hypothetical protein